MMPLISRSCAGFVYELISDTVSDSTPESIRSRTICSTCSGSIALTTSPCALIRSSASRVSSSAAGGSGLIMMIQPASGPGVCERARCRIWPKPWVVTRPTRAPLDSSTALVATVVPWTTLRSALGSMPASPQMRRTPASTPSDGSLGVDGVLTRHWRWSSSTRNRSVNVPPTSTPSRYATSAPLSSHHTLLTKLGELALLDPELAQHLVRVRPHVPARRVPDRARRVAQLRDHSRHRHLAVHLVHVRDEQPALA